MMSIAEPVSCDTHAARSGRGGPMARLSWSSGHYHSMPAFLLVDHDTADRCRLQAVHDEGGEVPSDQGMMSIFSPCSSCTTASPAAHHADAGADRGRSSCHADHADLGAAAGSRAAA
jgi:hypothetical protein